MDWLGLQLQARYGKHGTVKMQEKDFLHIGHRYLDNYPDGSMTTDLQHFIRGIEEPVVPSNPAAPLDDDGIAAVQSVAGNLTYASPERPDKCGEIAMVQQMNEYFREREQQIHTVLATLTQQARACPPYGSCSTTWTKTTTGR